MKQQQNPINQRIKQIKTENRLTNKLFSERVGLSEDTIKSLFSKDTNPSTETLIKIYSAFPLYSLEWILTGNENTGIVGNNASIASERVCAGRQDEWDFVSLYDVSAAAGYGTFDEMISGEKIIGRYYIPDFKNVDWMIYVTGSSMYPKYSSGDIIACREIKESRFIQWGKVYVVATREQGLLVKRLKASENKDCIKAVPDNPDYDAFDIPKDEILGIALVIGVIRLE
ncbi:MAG: helix-turn-helix domain-containing protein [Prevotellaceae bacterium]|jgi:phage repressor protein C with HTH and peptisase S24 domain|nr:helix-turn-helix domain-containing protein [Prevotellaceae bacterium]